uniref:TolC family protein n=1 Tax=Fulvivirga sp. TaxID=1931237 RepID=UPI004048FAAD
MKIKHLLFFAVWSVSFASHGQTNGEFTLEQCIAYALEQNTQIKNAKLETEISKASIGEVRAIGLPQINADISFNNNIAIQTSFLGDFISPVTYGVLKQEGLIENVPTFDSPPIAAQFGTKYTALGGVSVRQLIFDGSYFVALKASNTYKEVAQKEQVKTTIDVVEAVEKGYYAVLVAQENLELLATNFYRVDSLYRETSILYENGFAEKIDVNRISIQRNNIRTDLKNAAESLATTVSFLKYSMGMPMNEPFKVIGDLSAITLETVDFDLTNFNHNSRIEFDILNTNRALVDLDIKRYQVQYIPTISASFNAGYNSGTNQFSNVTKFSDNTVWFNYSNWGLSMSIPIFDGLRKSYTIQQKKLQARQLENTQKDLQNAIDLEILKSKIGLNNSLESLKTQEENMKLAKEVFDITRIKYQEGVGSNFELIEADAAYKSAHISYSNALYSALISRIELKKALGILSNQK